ncbi:WbqC family protein [Portibacter marinus]|uniref:WbqC family protein n=1 Tax=Portibacter marinus TaxID=2898660 RepID=UPI001F1FA0EE|nr:WbqC family protein [Portibacter marinus]
MTNVLIEIQYFPPIAYFALMESYDIFTIDQHEHYQKGGYRNRMYVLSPQGPLALSVPLKSGKNSQMPIREVAIDHSENWQVNHIRSIKTCYGKSPYFEYYFHLFEPIFEKSYQYLFDLNLDIIDKCQEVLELKADIKLSSQFLENETFKIDIRRGALSPKKKHQQKIEQQYNFPIYDQVFSDERPFAPNLSILDLIFCLGPEARLYLASTINKK